jgi:hypothetical protein
MIRAIQTVIGVATGSRVGVGASNANKAPHTYGAVGCIAFHEKAFKLEMKFISLLC